MINLALIGAGRMGKCHADAIKKIDGMKIYGVLDPDEKAANSFSETYKTETVYTSISELISDKEVDGVLLCNFTDQHFQSLSELIGAGFKNIFCEKALVRRLADGKKLLEMAEKNSVRVMVGHHRRYDKGYIEIKRIVDAGELGRIRMARIHYCFGGYAREWGDFFADFARSGGVTLDMMSHLFDQLNWYFGSALSVSGNSVRFDRAQPKPMDYISGTVTYNDSIICGIDGSWQRHGENCDRIEVYGDDACVVYNFGKPHINIYRNKDHIIRDLGESDAYLEQMKALKEMVENGTVPTNSLEAGFESARIALSMLEAVESKRTIIL